MFQPATTRHMLGRVVLCIMFQPATTRHMLGRVVLLKKLTLRMNLDKAASPPPS